MRWADGFIAVDWGTTNRRAYRIGCGGRRGDEMEDDRGILAVPDGGFPDAIAAIRDRFGDLPLLMAGMIGSNRGWKDVPYIPCPASLPDLASAIHWVEPDRTGIVPGVAWTEGEAADVMRGEEVQILGAFAQKMIPADAIVCHPGTHNKWIRLESGRITAFRTVMTGEIFNLLREHSILADLLEPPVAAGAAFEAGVRRGLGSDDLNAELFSIRARTLLGKAARDEAASYTSGLLIGSDVGIGLRFAGMVDKGGGEIVTMGRPELTGLYAAAIGHAGRACREVDGEEAFIAGIMQLAELVR